LASSMTGTDIIATDSSMDWAAPWPFGLRITAKRGGAVQAQQGTTRHNKAGSAGGAA
jgi:hypothetical protein